MDFTRSLTGVYKNSSWTPDRLLIRVEHGYGNTRGVSETGTAGTGTVVDFDTPQYTATRTRGVAGIHGLNICLR